MSLNKMKTKSSYVLTKKQICNIIFEFCHIKLWSVLWEMTKNYSEKILVFTWKVCRWFSRSAHNLPPSSYISIIFTFTSGFCLKKKHITNGEVLFTLKLREPLIYLHFHLVKLAWTSGKLNCKLWKRLWSSSADWPFALDLS